MAEKDRYIICAEDDPDIRAITVQALQLHMPGFTILEAQNGDEAYELAQQYAGRVSALISDCEMGPGRNGNDLAREFAGRFCVLLVTARPNKIDHDFHNQGMVFRKPLESDALIRIIKDRLRASMAKAPKKEAGSDGKDIAA